MRQVNGSAYVLGRVEGTAPGAARGCARRPPRRFPGAAARRCDEGTDVDADTRKALIAKYKAGYAEVVKALEGFPTGELTARPIPGKWTAAEIVHHLADSETHSATRLRKLLAEPYPVIQAYDEAE